MDTWFVSPVSAHSSCLRLLQKLSSQRQLSWSLTLLSPSFTALSSHHIILHGNEPKSNNGNCLYVRAQACAVTCSSVIVPCHVCHFCATVLCGARFAAQSCTNWVFKVHIQAPIPIMQTIKNLRRTVFYNLILK